MLIYSVPKLQVGEIIHIGLIWDETLQILMFKHTFLSQY